MPERTYTEYAKLDSDNQLGSPPLRYPEGWKGSDVNGAMAALASAVRNLGDAAAKLPLDEDGLPNASTNGGKIGSAAFQNIDSFAASGGTTYNRSRKVAGADLRLFYGTADAAAAEASYGWAICDGRTVNSITTPDLRSKFIQGWSNAEAPGATGGSRTLSTAEDGIHAHVGTTDGHALTESELPWQKDGHTFVGTGGANNVQGVADRTATAHTHDFETDEGGIHVHSIPDGRPPYFCVVYLMYVGS